MGLTGEGQARNPFMDQSCPQGAGAASARIKGQDPLGNSLINAHLEPPTPQAGPDIPDCPQAGGRQHM